jgi:hypothetical protein
MIQFAPMALSALSSIGGLSQHKHYMTPEELKQKFGTGAIGADTTALANNILNSPYGQQLMASSARAGQGIETGLARNAAESGLGAGSGATSGASDFAAATAPQAAGALQGQARAGVYQAAMPIAASMEGNLMKAALYQQTQQNQTPNTMQLLGTAGGNTLASMPPAAAPVAPAGANIGGTDSVSNALRTAAETPYTAPGLLQANRTAPQMPTIGPSVAVNPNAARSRMRATLTGGRAVRPAAQGWG